MDVYPILTYRDVRAALAWLKNAFGLHVLDFEAATDSSNHAALIHRDGMVLIESERPAELHGSHTGRGWVYIAVDDIDASFRRTLASGAEMVNEPHDAMNGNQRGYSVRDPEGNLWTFGTAHPQSTPADGPVHPSRTAD